MLTRPVVVGVDDSAATRSALLWASEEAALAGAELLIVHSPPQLAVPTSRGLAEVALRAAEDVGRAVLDASAALARAHQPAVSVAQILSHEEPARALIDMSADADLVVLGSQAGLPGEGSIIGSKRMLVAAHAHCPVLLVGPTSSFSRPSLIRRVVVGASDTSAGRAAVEFAAAEADRRGVVLQLVQISALDDSGGVGAPEAETALPALHERIIRAFPRLRVAVESVRGEAGEILPIYSDSETIVVVGCHHSEDRWSSRLGPVATSVIHRGRGPIVVVGSAIRRAVSLWAG